MKAASPVWQSLSCKTIADCGDNVKRRSENVLLRNDSTRRIYPYYYCQNHVLGNSGNLSQDEETQMMSGMAWATVGEMEPKLHQLEQSIEHGLPGKLMKIEACLGPAKRKVEDLQKQYEGQV